MKCDAIRDKVAVVGVGCCRFGENWDQAPSDMIVDAAYEAYADADIEDPQRQIDAVFTGSIYSNKGPHECSDALKLFGKPVTMVSNYCATGTDAFRCGVLSIAARLYDTVLVVGYDKPKDRGVSGPSTKRMESAEAAIEIAQANPSVWQTHGDIIVKSQDWPGAEEWAKRTRAVMPPELRAAIEKEEAQDAPDDKVMQVMEAAQTEIQSRDQMLEQAKAMLQKMQEELDNAKDAEKAKKAEVQIKAYEAETKRVELLMPFMTPLQLAALTTQTTQQAATPEDLVTAYVSRKAVDAPPEVVPQAIPPDSIPQMQPEGEQPLMM